MLFDCSTVRTLVRSAGAALLLLAAAGCSTQQSPGSGAGAPPAAAPVAPAFTAKWIESGPPPQFTAPKVDTPAPSGQTPDLDVVYPFAPPLKATFGYGVASGDMTSDSAVLWTRTASSLAVTPELAESESFANPVSLAAGKTTEATDLTAKVIVSGLKPGTQYYFRFKAGQEVSPTGSFKTAYLANEKRPVTLGFSGDVDWKWKPYPLLSTLAKEKLDFFIFLGDLIYETRNLRASVSAESLDDYRAKYRENREPRAGTSLTTVPMQELYKAFGQYQVFDNHETGPSQADKSAPPYNDGGVLVNGVPVAKTPGYQARVRAFSEYQPLREETMDGTQKFYRTIPWGGNLRLFIVDDRSFRDRRLANSDLPDATSCSRTMLGATQLKWLQDQLLAAKAEGVVWKVMVASSPMQALGRASQTGVDVDGGKSWAGGYNCERSKLLKFIDDNAINNVVVLTTDNHYTVINNLSYNSDPADPKSPLKPARNTFEVLTGPMGADNKVPGFKVDFSKFGLREGDRAIVDVWNGDAPNADGEPKGLKQAGGDPIGLEAGFPGLDVASIVAQGVPAGKVDPLAFVSWRTFSYATLTFDEQSLAVRVMAAPAVADPVTLLKSDALKQYEDSKPSEVLRFKVKAQ